MIQTPLYLSFPDFATALSVARALSGNPDVTALPPDGWLDGHYYVIDATPDAMHPSATYECNGLWRGPDNTVPAALARYRIYPATPSVVFG